MFGKILIDNRGEIALRILRACHDLGIEAVVAYAKLDRDSLPVRLAEEKICVGPGPAASYLNVAALVSAARSSAPTRSIRVTASWRRTPMPPRSAANANRRSSARRA